MKETILCGKEKLWATIWRNKPDEYVKDLIRKDWDMDHFKGFYTTFKRYKFSEKSENLLIHEKVPIHWLRLPGLGDVRYSTDIVFFL